MNINGLKTYSVSSFRGLDKENKLIKVEPFRAADGKNFIIDSNTLKTRPAIKYVDEIPFTIEENDFVIDWHHFRDVNIFVTRFHIYVEYNGVSVNESHSSFVLGPIGQIDFDNLQPIFQEEKNALFIFGLGDVYVFSYIRNINGGPHQYVFYSLKNKPNNPYQLDSDFFNQYRGLPFAYEPTIFLGNTRFEDINLLSNARKYKTFAASGEVTEGGLQSYYLPADYDENKHGSFDFEVSFYDGQFDELINNDDNENIYPIFLGISGEHFQAGQLSEFGTVLNPNALINVQEIYKTNLPFEFFGTSQDATPTPIRNIVGLDQDWFLRARVLKFGTDVENKDVFNFLMSYIRENVATLKNFNRVLAFNVPIEYNAIYKDATTNFIVESKMEKSNVIVYVQLKSLEIDSLQFLNENTQGSTVLITQDIQSETYPAYPTTSGTFTDFNVSTNPILTSSLSLSEFRNSARAILRNNRENLSDEENVRVFGQYYEQINQTSTPTASVSAFQNWIFNRVNSFENITISVNLPEKEQIEYSPQAAFPSYPTIPQGYTIENLNNGNPIELNNFTQSNFQTAANSLLNGKISTYTDGQKVAVRGQYFERESEVQPATASVYPINHWSYLFDFELFLNPFVFPYSPGGPFSVVLPDFEYNFTGKTEAEVDDVFKPIFDSYGAANRESFRQYYELGSGELVLTALHPTNRLNPQNWQLTSGGPFLPYVDNQVFVSPGQYTITFDPASAFATVLRNTEAYRSFYRFRNSSNAIIAGPFYFEDIYATELSGSRIITVPANAATMDIIVHRSSGVTDQQFLDGFVNTWNTRVAQSLTKWLPVAVNNDGSIVFRNNVTFNNASTFEPFETGYNTQGFPELGPFFLDYNAPDSKFLPLDNGFINAARNEILALVDDIPNPSSGGGYAKIYAQGTNGTGGIYGASLVIRFDYRKTGPVEYQWRQSFVMLTDVSTIIQEDNDITLGQASTIDGGAYPTFANPNVFPEIILPSTANPLITQEGISFNYGSTLISQLQTFILQQVPSLPGEVDQQYNGFAKVKIQRESATDTAGVSIVIPFTYSKEFTLNSQRRQSMVYTAQIEKETEVIGNELFEFFYDRTEKRFELRLKDYFYDYNNEPSISVRIEYERNPDYDFIANTRFGATFGSENRLFLAGHPDFPNIDRYNVSNDLLGDNIENQSYELSFFPSKNYRVIGGKGAINGYVVATDTILYVTKENYPNDEKLFIRQRLLDENGVVGYNEFKTSINKTPLNHRSIVRFNNDIVMLTKDGLYALEISNNVLTDERLMKLRSGFINRELVAKINAYDPKKIFILENNLYMYIFIGQDLYVADSRYTAQNENNIIENISYEIIYWSLPKTFKTGKVEENTFKILNETGKFMYTLDEKQNFDDKLERYDQISNFFSSSSNFSDVGNDAFQIPISLQDVVANPEKYSIRFYGGYKIVGKENIDFTYNNGVVTYLKMESFRSIEPGKTYFFKDNAGVFHPFTVESTTPLQSFTLNPNTSGEKNIIYESISGKDLYISTVFTFNQINHVRLSPYVQTDVLRFTRNAAETDEEYTARLVSNFKDNEEYAFESQGLKDIIINEQKPIEMVWISGITDLGNRLMEKKTYKFNVYATKKENENTITIGYTTRRRGFDETKNDINVSNPNTFKRLSLSNYGSTTFRESGFSIPMKENNFLYIQFMLEGTGQVEINGFDVLYVNNRLLKTVG